MMYFVEQQSEKLKTGHLTTEKKSSIVKDELIEIFKNDKDKKKLDEFY